jgi:hypothetical protein
MTPIAVSDLAKTSYVALATDSTADFREKSQNCVDFQSHYCDT